MDRLSVSPSPADSGHRMVFTSPAAAAGRVKSPLGRSESRGGRGSRRSSIDRQLSTTATVELVVSDPHLDEQTVKKLSAMAVDEEKKSDLRRSFLLAGKRSRQSPMLGSGGVPRRRSMGSLNIGTPTGERVLSRSSFSVDQSDVQSFTERSFASRANIDSDSGSGRSTYASVRSGSPGSDDDDSRHPNRAEAGHVAKDRVRRSVSSGGLPIVSSSSHNGYHTPISTAQLSRHDSGNLSGDLSMVSMNGVQNSRHPAESTPDPQPGQRRSSLRPTIGHGVGDMVAVSPIPECSSGELSMSPTPPPPQPPPAPPLPAHLLAESTTSDDFEEMSAPQGPRQRKKTIAILDESQVDLEEALDVIREQEDEIAVLHYQLEDMKDQFEMLEMSASENEHLLHQATDSNARLRYVDGQREEEAQRLRVMVGFLQEVLAGFDVQLPDVGKLQDVESRLTELERVGAQLKNEVDNATTTDSWPAPRDDQNSQRQSPASPSIMSIPAAILNRVRTPEWLGGAQRSPSPMRRSRVSRESSVDPPVFTSESSNSPLRSGRSLDPKLFRYSGEVLKGRESPSSGSESRLTRDSLAEPTLSSHFTASTSASSSATDQAHLPVISAAVSHDHDYVFPNKGNDTSTPSRTVAHDHNYTSLSSPVLVPSQASMSHQPMAMATTSAESGYDSVPSVVSGADSRPSSRLSNESVDGLGRLSPARSNTPTRRSAAVAAATTRVASTTAAAAAAPVQIGLVASDQAGMAKSANRDWHGRPPPPARSDSIKKKTKASPEGSGAWTQFPPSSTSPTPYQERANHHTDGHSVMATASASAAAPVRQAQKMPTSRLVAGVRHTFGRNSSATVEMPYSTTNGIGPQRNMVPPTAANRIQDAMAARRQSMPASAYQHMYRTSGRQGENHSARDAAAGFTPTYSPEPPVTSPGSRRRSMESMTPLNKTTLSALSPADGRTPSISQAAETEV